VRIAEELRTLVAAHSFIAETTELRITMSVGVATLNGVMQAEQLYKAADDLLYQAKRTGRNRVCY
jgi:diguanylate cyclase (GGDEF)-like protein